MVTEDVTGPRTGAGQVETEMSPQDALDCVRTGGAHRLLDLRTGVEFDGEHVEGALHIPLDEVTARVDEIRAATVDGPLLLLCRTGARATKAQKTLAGLGVTETRVVQRGIEGWRAVGGDTIRGVERMSLERQVRIAAGSLGLVGVLLGFLAHQAFFFLSGFVSAGLIFAGLTDWCGMGLLLARMPWNRTRG